MPLPLRPSLPEAGVIGHYCDFDICTFRNSGDGMPAVYSMPGDAVRCSAQILQMSRSAGCVGWLYCGLAPAYYGYDRWLLGRAALHIVTGRASMIFFFRELDAAE